MKWLTSTLVLFSWATFACPNLAGTYAVCRSQNHILTESTNLKVDQSTVDGVNHFAVSFLAEGASDRESYVLVADGQTVTESWTDDMVTYEAKTTVYCMADTVVLKSEVKADGAPFKSEESGIYLLNGNLVQVTSGKLNGRPFNDRLDCR